MDRAIIIRIHDVPVVDEGVGKEFGVLLGGQFLVQIVSASDLFRRLGFRIFDVTLLSRLFVGYQGGDGRSRFLIGVFLLGDTPRERLLGRNGS